MQGYEWVLNDEGDVLEIALEHVLEEELEWLVERHVEIKSVLEQNFGNADLTWASDWRGAFEKEQAWALKHTYCNHRHEERAAKGTISCSEPASVGRPGPGRTPPWSTVHQSYMR